MLVLVRVLLSERNILCTYTIYLGYHVKPSSIFISGEWLDLKWSSPFI